MKHQNKKWRRDSKGKIHKWKFKISVKCGTKIWRKRRTSR